MTRLFFALVLVIITIGQATILPSVNVLGIGPNPALVLLLIWSAMRGVPEGLLWAFLVGLLLDLLTLDPLGSSGLALLPVVLIGGLARRQLFHSGLIVPMLLVVAATLTYQLASSAIGLAFGTSYPLLTILRLGMLMALLNLVLVPPLYLAVRSLQRLGVGSAASA